MSPSLVLLPTTLLEMEQGLWENRAVIDKSESVWRAMDRSDVGTGEQKNHPNTGGQMEEETGQKGNSCQSHTEGLLPLHPGLCYLCSRGFLAW
jgi:hypothetical protein